MTEMEITANGKTHKAGEDPNEDLSVSAAVGVETDHRGVMTARPPHLVVNVTRTVPRAKGTFTLMGVAVASQRFDLKAKNKDKHSKGRFVEKTVHGTEVVPLRQTDVEDFQPSEWGFSWTGGGNDGLKGLLLVERLQLIASAGRIVNLLDKETVAFDLR